MSLFLLKFVFLTIRTVTNTYKICIFVLINSISNAA